MKNHTLTVFPLCLVSFCLVSFRLDLGSGGTVHAATPGLAENLSTSTLCAEEDNINIPISGNVTSFVVEATHPTHAVVDFSCAPDFTSCPPAGPGHDFSPGSFTLWDDGTTVVTAVREAVWWLPKGMKATVDDHSSHSDIHYVAVSRKIVGADQWPQFFVLYMDGNMRLIPHPPAGQPAVCFGTSVIVGPAPKAARPYAEISAVNYISEAQVMEVTYAGGGSARLALNDVNRTRARVAVEVLYPVNEDPFVTFRSMYVSDGNADADRMSSTATGGTLRHETALGFSGGPGQEWWLNRVQPSTHNPSAPDIRISGLDGPGDVLDVPGEYSTIQSAIDAASPGDTIRVAAGLYQEHLVLKSGLLMLGTGGGVSTPDDPVDDSIIDGTDSGRAVTLSGVDNVTLRGFTIINGGGANGANVYVMTSSNVDIQDNLIADGFTNHSGAFGYGAGIYSSSSTARIEGNLIQNNNAWGKGGGLYLLNFEGAVLRNTLANNQADFGGAIYLWRSSPLIAGNVIEGNYTTLSTGGGLYLNDSSPDVINNTIVDNEALAFGNGRGAGIYVTNSSHPRILNNIIAHNHANTMSGGIYCTVDSAPFYLNRNNFFDNVVAAGQADYFGCGPGNTSISSDPLFVDPTNSDYRLQAGSPSVDAGHPAAAFNDEDGTRNDLGAFGGPLIAASFAALLIFADGFESGDPSAWSPAR